MGFTPLSTCRRPVKDLFPEVGELKGWVGGYLTEAEKKTGNVGKFVAERLSPEARDALVKYMQH